LTNGSTSVTVAARGSMAIGVLTIELSLSGLCSLKQKRSQIKPLLIRLHKEFNVSVSEVGFQDKSDNARIACCIICSDDAPIQQTFNQIVRFMESRFPEIRIESHSVEFF
jgi:uncharacterized protein YlxP (DUF503 family)